MSDDASRTVKSADRVLDIFELLARSAHELSHTEIVEHLEIPKSSLTPLLRNLVSRGFLNVSPNGRTYRIGATLRELSRKAQLAHDLVTAAGPFLAQITQATGESSALNELRGDLVETVATVNGPNRLMAHMRLGDLAPLYATSGGKVILAHREEADRRAYLTGMRCTPITPKTLRSRKAVEEQLLEIRRTGFAYSFEEYTPGIVGIAVALLDDGGRPLASLNVAMPAVRYDEASRAVVEAALRDAAAGFRRQLGLA